MVADRGVGPPGGRCAVVVGGQTPGATIGNGGHGGAVRPARGTRLVDRSAEQLAGTVAMIRAEVPDAEFVEGVADIAADAGPAEVVAAAVTAFGGFDILHNNVGIGAGDAPPHLLTDEAYDRIMDVNLRAMWRMCRAAVPELRRSGRSAIVNVSSLAAVASAGALTAYRLSKAGVNTLTTSLAFTNAKYGLRVNAIMPGFVDTPMGVDAAAGDGHRPHEYRRRAAQVPLGRQGSAWDIAAAAVFLASDDAEWITGVILPVDGGQSIRVG